MGRLHFHKIRLDENLKFGAQEIWSHSNVVALSIKIISKTCNQKTYLTNAIYYYDKLNNLCLYISGYTIPENIQLSTI